jgi:hypothetical protein
VRRNNAVIAAFFFGVAAVMAEPLLYCTYFDSNFAVRGLTMIRSLARHRKSGWRMVVLCLDEAIVEILTRLRSSEPALDLVELVPLARLEAEDRELLALKSTRSWLEYIYTCKAALCRWLYKSRPDAATLVYVDADLYFFASDQALFAEMGQAPAALTLHRYPEGLEYQTDLFGRFNAGWLCVNRSLAAQACLERWRSQCIAWCGDSIERGQYGDQKYLDDWPLIASDLSVIGNPGTNLAPWNLRRHSLQPVANGPPLVDGRPVIFFHFHALNRYAGPGDYVAVFNIPHGGPAAAVTELYEPYLAELISVDEQVRALAGELVPVRAGRLLPRTEPATGRPIRVGMVDALRARLRGRLVHFRAGRADLLWRMLVRIKAIA